MLEHICCPFCYTAVVKFGRFLISALDVSWGVFMREQQCFLRPRDEFTHPSTLSIKERKTMRRQRRQRLVVAAMLLLALVVTACGQNISTGTDEVICVYGAGGGDGKELKSGPLLPSSDVINVRDDRKVVRIPVSNRFYAITTDGELRDPGAPTYFEVEDANGIPIRIEVWVRFVFNAETACEWFNQHGIRNAAGGTYYSEDGTTAMELEPYDMGFNVRGIVAPWFFWLAENFGIELERAVRLGGRQTTWAHWEYDYALTANEYGNVPEGVDVNSVTTTYQWAEQFLSEEFSQELNAKLGADPLGRNYFCGVGHNQARPNECGNMVVEILDAYAVNRSLPDGRAAVLQAQEDLENNRLLDNVEAQNLVINQLARERNEAEAIAAAASEARIQTAELEAQLDPNFLELQQQQAVLEATRYIAACQAVDARDLYCALILAAIRGVNLPLYIGDLSGLPSVSDLPTGEGG